jgi:hypothetical protein
MSIAGTGLSGDDGRRRPPKFPDAYRTRHEAAEYLQSRGYPLSFSTLTKLCALGEGPDPAAWWGYRPLYTDAGLDAWAENRSRRGRPRTPLTPPPSAASGPTQPHASLQPKGSKGAPNSPVRSPSEPVNLQRPDEK